MPCRTRAGVSNRPCWVRQTATRAPCLRTVPSHDNLGCMSNAVGHISTVGTLVTTPDGAVLGDLIAHAARVGIGTHTHDQTRAWTETLEVLRNGLTELAAAEPESTSWRVVLEYEIPRRSGRIDCVILARERLLVLEFKSGPSDRAAERQVEDYALELSDFHAGSHGRMILPIVCAGQAPTTRIGRPRDGSGVWDVTVTSHAHLGTALTALVCGADRAEPLDGNWVSAAYQPTPTIIEAARALYSGHEVVDITHSAASANQLHQTNAAVAEVMADARATGKKAICFITGIPGAGKTLAGLNVAHSLERGQGTFLSGNSPLVQVLREALARDEAKRTGASRSDCRRRSSTFITNVHKWLDEYIDRSPDGIPSEHVIVFDEAQRAWSREHSNRKFSRDSSEPSMILSVMNRRPDWAVIVALVGGGQEINVGEAGLGEWGRSLTTEFNEWSVVVAPELAAGTTDVAGGALFEAVTTELETRVEQDPRLHLRTSRRSYRTLRLTKWVEAMLTGDANAAAGEAPDPGEYPIHVTRDLGEAREWLRARSRGLRRCGLVASSGARRLRAHGLDVKAEFDPADWFLAEQDDVRSSNCLEIPATEFGIQGLELDWVGLAWGADFRRGTDSWRFRQFRGTKWQAVNDEVRRQYLINKYRVLLTRARQGVVIWVPEGNEEDPTRRPEFYDPTFEFLRSCLPGERETA